jgi:hypothetical protein
MIVIRSTQKQYQATFWYNNKDTTTINLNSIEDLKNKLNLEYTNTNCHKIRVFDALIEDIEGVGIVPTLKKIINVKRVDNQWVASKTHLDIKNFIHDQTKGQKTMNENSIKKIKKFCIERIDLPMTQIQDALKKANWTKTSINICGVTFYDRNGEISYSLGGNTSYTI